jgi:osmotically-inducible protein OsmY
MNKQGRLVFILLTACALLSGCLSNLWTGATLLYDRHNVYKKVNDYQLAAKVNQAVYKDRVFKRKDCSIDLAVFNGDILMTGHVPSQDLRQEAIQRVSRLGGYRRLINQIEVGIQSDNSVEDSWITAKIRGHIFADSEIDPNAFKVITADQIVYLMGDVRPQQANKVIYIARNTEGVKRVVKLLKYFNLSEKALVDS